MILVMVMMTMTMIMMMMITKITMMEMIIMMAMMAMMMMITMMMTMMLMMTKCLGHNLRSFSVFLNSPSFNFILAGCEIVHELEGFVSLSYNLGEAAV